MYMYGAGLCQVVPVGPLSKAINLQLQLRTLCVRASETIELRALKVPGWRYSNKNTV